MQSRFARFLLALALVLAIPVQGFAAATADLCMLGHHDASMHSHEGDTGTHPQHDHGSLPASAHCAPCVACCAAAAIAHSMPLVLADERADAVVVAGPPSFADVALGTLDRPPLSV